MQISNEYWALCDSSAFDFQIDRKVGKFEIQTTIFTQRNFFDVGIEWSRFIFRLINPSTYVWMTTNFIIKFMKTKYIRPRNSKELFVPALLSEW